MPDKWGVELCPNGKGGKIYKQLTSNERTGFFMTEQSFQELTVKMVR